MKNFDESAAWVLDQEMNEVVKEDNLLKMLIKKIMKDEPSLDEEGAWAIAIDQLETIEEWEEEEE